MRADAFDYVVKPVSLQRLKSAVANALKAERVESETDGPAKRRNRILTRFCVRSDPAGQFAPSQRPDDIHAIVAVIQAGNMGEVLPTGFTKNLSGLAGDFLKRLQAVRYKAGIEHRDRFHPVLREFFDGLVGVGLQPFLRPEA